jgi:hypothetical protein
MSDETLKNMQETLEDIRAILLLTRSSDIEEAKKKSLKEGSEQYKIYQLCDGKTTQEIATGVQKSADYVSSNLTLLKRKGLIKTVERDGKKVHEQRF